MSHVPSITELRDCLVNVAFVRTFPMYEWIKALHVIAVIAWMAGMLYLPRLFVYHCQTPPGSEGSERFKVMERKLLKGIINPSMMAVWLFGLTLAWLTEAYLEPWFQLKFLLVVILSGFHGFLVR